jgi:uncharacterized membrane protein YbjE (DUF340 family)
VEFDPFLYLAFGLGLLAGWAVRPRSAWVGRATLATVGVLLALLGASLSGLSAASLELGIPVGLGFAALVLGLTVAVYLAIGRYVAIDPSRVAPAEVPRSPYGPTAGLLAALVVGFVLGRLVSVPAGAAIPFALYALLFLVAFDLRLTPAGLGRVWAPLSAAVAGGLLGGILFALVSRISLVVSLSSSLAFGWYSLAGPLVEARAGALLGLVAFLTNFLREDLTMLLAPALGRRVRGGGLAAMGGATSMDTTLYFITRYGDRESANIALATGLILTVSASLLLPALLAAA